MDVSLEPVSRRTVRAVCELQVAPTQRSLVAPAAFTVSEGHYEPGALLRAIHLGVEAVGVLLVEVEGPTPHLVRFMIDEQHQRQGIGREAVELLVRELEGAGWNSLETSFVPVEGGAEGFWQRCGFTDTGRRADGEPVWVRTLGSRPGR